MQNIKICNAIQASTVHQYTNIKRKLLRANACLWFNKQCQIKGLTPNYANIKIKGNTIATQKTQEQAIKCTRIGNGIKLKFKYLSVSRQVHSLFQTEFSKECDLELISRRNQTTVRQKT
jgi:hypothetical protein